MSNKKKSLNPDETTGKPRNWANTIGTIAIAMVLGAVLYAVIFKKQQPPAPPATSAAPATTAATTAAATTPPPQPAACPTRAGSPWEFDAPTNCHWNPAPGHVHWHQGPAPDAATQASMMAGEAPQPFQLQPVPAPGDGSAP